jgi:hypothetical protein
MADLGILCGFFHHLGEVYITIKKDVKYGVTKIRGGKEDQPEQAAVGHEQWISADLIAEQSRLEKGGS